jgi:PIN domain nuclease of toxin-antitoxin system
LIVLDTHAWVWWVNGSPDLSGRARRTIDEVIQHEAALVSCISSWEVAMLVARGRLDLSLDVREWIARTEALPFLRFVPVDNQIAVRAVLLPRTIHPDPADRLIVATALVAGASLITKDARLRRSAELTTVW